MKNILKSDHEENNELLMSSMKREIFQTHKYILKTCAVFSKSIVTTLEGAMESFKQNNLFYLFLLLLF